MASLVTNVILFTLLMAAFAAPAVTIAHRAGRPAIARRFLVAVPVCGLLCGLSAAGSERLINQCLNAGNTRCFDGGGAGFIFLVAGAMLAVSLVSAWVVARH